MNYLKFINDKGASLTIGDSKDYALFDLSGVNPPKASINTSFIAGFDGSTYISSYVNQRNILLTLQINGNIEANRLKLYDIFKIKRKGTFYYSSDLINVKIEAYVENIDIPPMAWPVKAVISLLCPHPYFEALDNIISDIASIDYKLEFPLELTSDGIEFGSFNPAQAINVYNPGDIPVGMLVKYRATGSVINPKLINTHTLEFIELETTLESGDVITINTEVGKKRIELLRNGVIYNLFNTLVVGSTFIQLSEGDNVLYSSSESGSSALLTEVQFIPKYSGV